MFAIRDDDTSYWTNVEEIEQLYGTYLERGAKISLAVVPQSVETFDRGDRTKMYQTENRKYIYENPELVNYLKDYIKKNQVEIMMHGYDHSYFVEFNGKIQFLDGKLRNEIGQNSDVRFVPECIHKDEWLLKKQIVEGKKILEDTFGTQVKVFVPPSNALKKEAVSVIESAGMNISGTMTNKFNRKVDLYSINIFAQKVIWRLKQRELSYPHVMKYAGHKELVGYAFTPTTNMQKFCKQYEYCQGKNYPFTLATHYWEILENKSLRKDFNSIMERAIKEQNWEFVSEAMD